MVREFNIKRYVIVGIITFLIFSLGITLGIIVSNARITSTEQQSKIQEIDFKEIQFQYLYLSTLEKSEANCNVLGIALDKSTSDLAESLQKFSMYKDKNTLKNDVEIELISRNYLLDNLKYWLFAEESKKACNLDLVSVLYFYSENNCEICPEQGVVLTYYKQLLQDKLLIFPINADLEDKDSIIKILRSKYNVTTYPSLVIENETFSGVIQKSDLEPLICNRYKDKNTCYK